MARADLINRLYSRNKTPLEFKFQSLTAPPLLSLLSPYDIQMLYNIARDPKLSAKLNKKLEMIQSILEPRGFIKFHSGTNRVVYRYLEDQSFLIKIALDKVGLGDNPMEFKNQFVLAPFITKVFEVSPCGTVGLFERVEPITSRQEFISIAEDVFDLINDKFVGEFVLEDIGTSYFMNWGIRRGFGPVLLDFPYCYKLDGNRLYCNKVDVSTGVACGGAIDYDMGFNNLICTKCGAKIFAKDLQAGIDKNNIIVKGRKEHSTMQVQCFIPGKGVTKNDTMLTAKNYAEQVKASKKTMEIAILNNKPLLSREEEMRQIIAQSQASKAKAEEAQKQKSEAREPVNPTFSSTEEVAETRNTNRHEYVAQKSAPYCRPQDPTIEAYLKMNGAEDEDEIREAITETIPNTLEKIYEKLEESSENAKIEEEELQEDAETEENGGSEDQTEDPESEQQQEEELTEHEEDDNEAPPVESEPEKVDEVKEVVDDKPAAVRDTARIRQTPTRRDDYGNSIIPNYDNDNGKYPAKKGGQQPRDKQGKFAKK